MQSSGEGKFGIHIIIIKAQISNFTTSHPGSYSYRTIAFPSPASVTHATTSQLFPSTIEVSLRLGIVSSTGGKEGISR